MIRQNSFQRYMEKTARAAYFPIVGLQALACGTAVALVHSKLSRSISNIEETNGFSRESAYQRFKEGIAAVLNAYGYNSHSNL